LSYFNLYLKESCEHKEVLLPKANDVAELKEDEHEKSFQYNFEIRPVSA